MAKPKTNRVRTRTDGGNSDAVVPVAGTQQAEMAYTPFGLVPIQSWNEEGLAVCGPYGDGSTHTFRREEITVVKKKEDVNG